MEIKQREASPLLWFEPSHGRNNFGSTLNLQLCVIRIGLLHHSVAFADFLKFQAAAFAQMVDAEVRRDTRQPGEKGSATAEFLHLSEGLDKHLAGQILRFLHVPDKLQTMQKEPLLVLLIKLPQIVGVAALEILPDELAVLVKASLRVAMPHAAPFL